ncbi:MAG: penicillin-insensitive murein endopeptidase [Planctomycetes bacterium]|nr:penicillin-insensitive murein endopeptidase [Planctomycetota bacterium]
MQGKTRIGAWALVALLGLAETARGHGSTWTAEVTASALHVRSGPDTRYRSLGLVYRGHRVQVVGAQGAWRRIPWGGGLAWAHGAWLRRVDPGAAPTTASAPSPAAAPAAGARPTSTAGFIQLAAAGPGFYTYSPAGNRWGTPRLVYGLERIGRRWATRRGPRLGVGDVSYARGGPMAGHASHRLGVDVDVRPVRGDGQEAPVTIGQGAYSRARTQGLLDLVVAELPVTMIFFNDRQTRHTQPWPNHDNHFHVRIRG